MSVVTKQGDEIQAYPIFLPTDPTDPIRNTSCPEIICPHQELDCPFVLDVYADTVELSYSPSSYLAGATNGYIYITGNKLTELVGTVYGTVVGNNVGNNGTYTIIHKTYNPLTGKTQLEVSPNVTTEAVGTGTINWLTSSNIDLNNDKSDFYYWADPGCSAITLILQKNNSNCGGCDWDDIYTFIFDKPEGGAGSSPYGQFFAFGNSPAFNGQSFIDDYGKKYTGLLLYWVRILLAFGEGQYRMKVVYTTVHPLSTITDYDQRVFCLHEWNCFNINESVRIETTNQGLRGNMNNNQVQIDYFTGWYGQIRLKGIFYYKSSSYVKEFNQYGEAAPDFNAYKPIINEQIPKYSLDVKPVPGWIHWILSTYVAQADSILITDYNASNPHTLIKTPVINDADVTPKSDDFVNPNALIILSLSHGYNNLRRRND